MKARKNSRKALLRLLLPLAALFFFFPRPPAAPPAPELPEPQAPPVAPPPPAPSASPAPAAQAAPPAEPRQLFLVTLASAPVDSSWPPLLAEAGATLLSFRPPAAYLASAPASALPALRTLPFVRDAAELPPESKIAPSLSRLAARAPDGAPLKVLLAVAVPADLPVLLRRLPPGAVPPDAPDRPARCLRLSLAPADLPAVAADPAVLWLEPWTPPQLCNDLAPASLGLPAFPPARPDLPLDGAGQTVAVADTGLSTGNFATLHPDFDTNRLAAFALARTNDWSDLSGHGTHVAASVVGTGAASTNLYRGIAPAASLVFQSVANANGKLIIPDDTSELFAPAYDLGARVHNDSWGHVPTDGYGNRDLSVDEFVWQHPDFLVVVSAGNEGIDSEGRGVCDAPTPVNSPGWAKNVLCVGAAESGRPPGSGGRTSKTYRGAWPKRYPADPIASDLVSTSPEGAPRGMAAFSSRGPAFDGRIKPDIVAPGTDIASALSSCASSVGWGVVPGNTNYCFNGGTSMSAPLAAGCAVLVRQAAAECFAVPNPSAALVKAALIGGARSLSPGQYGTGEFREIPAASPNLVEGYGMPDLAATLFPSDGTRAVFLDVPGGLNTGGTWEFAFTIETPGLPLTACLAWSDYPADPGVPLALVNDLDLSLRAPDGTLHALSNSIDNVERLVLPAADSGTWLLAVSAPNVPFGPQPFAVYLRADAHSPPDIAHDPLPNQSAAAPAYPVFARIASPAAWPTSSAALHVSVDGADPAVIALLPSADDPRAFSAEIPAAPLGATVAYWITAGATRLPADPDAAFTFVVAPDYPLVVTAPAAEAFSGFDPPLGTNWYPSGTTLRVSAPATLPLAEGTRLRQTAHPSAFDLLLTAPTNLEWTYQTEHRLTLVSDPADLFPAAATWHPAGTAATPAPVPNAIADSVFAAFYLDGARLPDDLSPSPPPSDPPAVLLDAPRTLAARYLPAEDPASPLPPWFLLRYFPSASPDPADDPDADGWSNADEAADFSDPLDPASYPAPPVIVPRPFPALLTDAPPIRVAADIADTRAVAFASLLFSLDGQPETALPLDPDPLEADLYATTLPALRDGDSITFRFTAADPLGLASTSPPVSATVSWPVLHLSPSNGFHADLSPSAPATLLLAVSNAGSRPLRVSASLAPAGLLDDLEGPVDAYSTLRLGTNASQWHLTDRDAASPAHAWRCTSSGYLPLYANNSDDSLLSPPLLLWPPNAPFPASNRLAFRHKASFEPAEAPGVYFDSAFLQFRPDPAADWSRIAPEDGYPATFDVDSSPCFADAPDWSPVAVPLPAPSPAPFAATSPATVRFRFRSDQYVQAEGWNLDDLAVTPATAFAAPSNWAALPAPDLILPPASAADLPVALDATPLPPAAIDYQFLLLSHDDPLLPSPLAIPLSLSSRARNLEIAAAGPGTLAPSGTYLHDAPPPPVTLSFAPDPAAILADFTLNGTPQPLPDDLSAPPPVTLDLSATNLAVHATFAIPPDASQIPPDAWFAAWGLTNRPPLAEAALDPDADGFLNWQECLLASDPLDPASAPLRLRLLPPSQTTDSTWRITFLAPTNLPPATHLALSTNLNAPPWSLLPLTLPPPIPPIVTSPPLPAAPAPHPTLLHLLP